MASEYRNINFVVAVRCQRLNLHKEAAAIARQTQQRDDYCCVFFNKTLPFSPCSTFTEENPPREETQASVVLVDPGVCGDFAVLRSSCVFSQEDQLLLSRLEVHELKRLLSKVDGARTFAFDDVFPPTATNEDIYNALVQPLVVAAERGYNGTFIAYGQTGTGKSYTVFGDKNHGVAGLCSLVAAGFFSCCRSRRSLATGGVSSSLKDKWRTLKVFVSFFELYNERLRDLLVDGASALLVDYTQCCGEGAKRNHLKTAKCGELDVVEHPEHGVIVPHLTTLSVHSVDELGRLLIQGNSRRAKAPTASNEVSSRSHAIVQFTVRRCIVDDIINREGVYFARNAEADVEEIKTQCRFFTARLLVVDLAGSERATAFGNAADVFSGEQNDYYGYGKPRRGRDNRRREGSNINRGLFALGNCISALGASCRLQKQQKQHGIQHAVGNFSHSFSTQKGLAHGVGEATLSGVHVPYRDSKLMRLLKESLGGNTRTVMLATVSPSCAAFEETLSTLKYASRARTITRCVFRNIVFGGVDDVEEERVKDDAQEAANGYQEVEGACKANFQLELPQMEAEVRSLVTRLRIAGIVAKNVGLSPAAGGWGGAVSVSAATRQAIVKSQEHTLRKLDFSGLIYDRLRRRLGGLREEIEENTKMWKNDMVERQSMRNKKLIRELVRQGRDRFLLNDCQQRVDTFLV